MIKHLKISNHPDAVEITDFNGVDAGVLFERRVIAAAKHFNIEIPENFNFRKKGSYILGDENDIYFLSISDSHEKAKSSEAPSIDLEFTDTEAKGELIDLLKRANECPHIIFQGFLDEYDFEINKISGQNKINTLSIPADVNAALIAEDVKNGLRPDTNKLPEGESLESDVEKPKRVRTKKIIK